MPLAFKPDQINHDFHWLLVMGRMKPGVTLAQAQADMEVVTNRIATDHPQSNKGWGASVEELHNDFFPKEAKQTLWLLMGGVGFILLIACGNVANLVLAKGTTRLKEVAVRTSLGASRWQIFSQFLTESLVLAVLGGALGIGLGWAIIKVMMAKMPAYTLPSEKSGPSARVSCQCRPPSLVHSWRSRQTQLTEPVPMLITPWDCDSRTTRCA